MEGFDCATDDPRCYCLLDDVLGLLGKKYVMDIVCVIAIHGTVRFGMLEKHIPDASTSTLSARLDDLEREGLLTRQQYDEIPPRVEYELTDDGAELAERLAPVLEWVQERNG
ncbi:transcriptional regulator [Halobacteriales archaeon QS_6_64_34]|nr:MAG: transcriptional regulator [Halobacteriales archaeon QS_6_64_34]